MCLKQTHKLIKFVIFQLIKDKEPEFHQVNKSKNKWGLIKRKNFCTAKETTDKMKKQLADQEKIFANGMTKNLISDIHKQLI